MFSFCSLLTNPQITTDKPPYAGVARSRLDVAILAERKPPAVLEDLLHHQGIRGIIESCWMSEQRERPTMRDNYINLRSLRSVTSDQSRWLRYAELLRQLILDWRPQAR